MNDQLSQVSFGAAPAATITAPEPAAARRRRPRRRLSRRLKRNVVGATFLAVTSAIMVVLLLLRPPHPATLVLVGADYADNLAVPDNALGWNGVNSLADLAQPQSTRSFWSRWREHKMVLGQEKIEPVKAKGRWNNDNRGWGAFSTPTVIFYIDLHGAADESGPYLLADGGLDERIPLREVFQFLKGNKELEGKNKVVLLDATKVLAHEPLTLHNDFVRRLKEDLKDDIEADEKLVVICASGEAERSWVSEEWGKSIFTQKVIEGLQGMADEDPKDKRINALELYNYVKRGVTAWAWDNRRAKQEPILLPGGEKGKERARRMEIALVEGQYSAPAPAKAPHATFAPPDWLTDAWKERDDLSERSPAPYVYAPHLWQEYLEVLLRCESLARAGYPNTEDGAVARLLKRGTTLREEIRRAGQPELDKSRGYSLALGELAGLPPRARDKFAEVWKTYDDEGQNEEKRGKAVAGLNKWIGEQKPATLGRLAFYSWLYDKVAESGQAELPRQLGVAHELVKQVSAGNPLPTETLFLSMLSQRLPKDVQQQQAARIITALRVRRLAERVALGLDPTQPAKEAALGERVVPLIRGKVEKADDKRRLAEDHLFAGGADDLKAADELFPGAEKLYGEAADEAGAARHALSVSARAHAELPRYAAWLAGADGDNLTHLTDYLKQAHDLWENTHKLDDLLRTADEHQGADARLLKERAEKVSSALGAVHDHFEREWDELIAHAEQRADIWQRLDGVLAVPLIPADKRKELLDKSRSVSAYLNEHTGLNPSRPPEAVGDAKVRELAQRRGRLAVDAIGERRFDNGAGAGKVPHLLALKELGWEDKRWDEHLDPVSRQVSSLLRGAADEVATRNNEARQVAAQPGKALDPLAKKALDTLAEADAACRQAPGGLLPEKAPNPLRLLRRWQTHDLLLWQAQRSLLDRWWSESQEPYFQKAGGACLADAAKLLVDEDEALAGERDGAFVRHAKDRAHQLDGDLSRPTVYEFKVAGGREGEPIHAAGRDDLTIDCHLVVSLPLPKGYSQPKDEPLAVVHVRLDDNGLARSARERPGVEVFPEPHAPALVSQSLERLEPLKLVLDGKAEPGALTTHQLAWKGWLRGKDFGQSVRVEARPGADTVITQLPVPPVGGISVRPDKDLTGEAAGRRGILVVVLDLTGSMGDPKNKLKDGKLRKDAALKALDLVLADVDDGTLVSVITFGQDNNDGREFRVPENSIRVQREASPWHKADRGDLIRKLDKLVPYHYSPIARAVWRSLEEFKNAEEQIGHPRAGVKKTLLVLSDGDDNRFDEDTALQTEARSRDIPGLLKKGFDGKGISVNMVALTDNKTEEHRREKANAKKQFQHAILNLRPRGTYFDGGEDGIPDYKQLARALREAMGLSSTYWVENGEDPELSLGTLDTVSRDLYWSESPAWHYHFFKAGEYNPGLRTRLDLDIRQPVILAPGELLFVKQERHGFRRAVVSDEKGFSDRPREPETGWTAKGWRMTLLRYVIRANNEQVLLTALEKKPEPVAAPDPERLPAPIRQARPRTIWLDVKAQGGRVLEGVQWAEERGAAAPIWKIQVPHGSDQKAVPLERVTAWVSQSHPSSFAERVFPERDSAPRDLKKPVAQTVTLNGNKIKVEVSEQRHEVLNGLGTRIPDFACLVVRAEYDDLSDPVRAVLPSSYDDAVRIGAEHHYSTAGKKGIYRGVFWFLDRNKYSPEKQVADLMLMSVAQFRKHEGTTQLLLPQERWGRPGNDADVVISELTEFDKIRALAKDLLEEKPVRRENEP